MLHKLKLMLLVRKLTQLILLRNKLGDEIRRVIDLGQVTEPVLMAKANFLQYDYQPESRQMLGRRTIDLLK